MTSSGEQFDVIVVGAGPAGTTAARHCSSAGLNTLLLEKVQIPRFKPCAGGLTVAAARELGFDIPQKNIERQCKGLRIIFRDLEREVETPETFAFMVSRSSFDQHLASMAVQVGTLFSANEGCTSIERNKNSVVVRTERRTLRAPVVIGADGFFSRVRKQFCPKFKQDEIRYCLLADIPMSPREISTRFKDLITIHFGTVPEGYAWIFPKSSHLNVGAGGSLSQSRDLPNLFRRFLILNQLDPEVKIKGCFLPVSRWRHDIYTDRILLTGDAAGLVDSFSGEGIRFAIASGKLAAETVIAVHKKDDFTAQTLREYQERCWEYMGRDLYRSNRATDLLYRHPNLIFGTVVRNQEALEHYLRSVTGEISFSDYMRWIKSRMPRYFINRFLLHERRSSADNFMDLL